MFGRGGGGGSIEPIEPPPLEPPLPRLKQYACTCTANIRKPAAACFDAFIAESLLENNFATQSSIDTYVYFDEPKPDRHYGLTNP